MKLRHKTLLMIISVLSLSVLSACSTMNQFPKKEGDRRFSFRDHKKSPEMKALMEQSKTLCNGKQDGQMVQAQVNGQTIDGQCELRFKPNKPAK